MVSSGQFLHVRVNDGRYMMGLLKYSRTSMDPAAGVGAEFPLDNR